jgi:hypothetical protein
VVDQGIDFLFRKLFAVFRHPAFAIHNRIEDSFNDTEAGMFCVFQTRSSDDAYRTERRDPKVNPIRF